MGNPTIKYDTGMQAVGTTFSAQSGMSATGSGAFKEVMAHVDKAPLVVLTGIITFSNSYVTGGEDISNVWKQFRPTARDTSRVPTAWDLRGIIINNVASVAGTEPATSLVLVRVDFTDKKLQVFTTLAAEAANASDQSAITVRFIAYGH